ncbi:MAG TPA: ATP-binding cassette domain-containing protein [Kofleriaceae bacterium]
MIELEGVVKRFGDALAVKGVSLTVAKGEFVAVLGESGSGKTTLVKMINRLVEPDAGVVRVAGKDVRGEDVVALRRRIGYVIQHVGLLPHLTVADNVATVPRLLRWSDAAIAARVAELLQLVGLPDVGTRYPEQLSGGQRQRIGVARALAAKPELLLLDEPLGALDPITRLGLQRELARIHKELGLTSVMVTHDMVEAFTLADRIAVMFRGELRQIATPHELASKPADDYVAKLVGLARDQAELVRRLG